MATSYQYDPIGADNGLFAPALIRGDPVSEQAVRDWEAAHLKKPPAYDPWYVPPPPPPVPGLTPDASTQRDRIAMQMVQGSGPGGGGDVATSIGSPTPSPTAPVMNSEPTPPVNEPTPPPTPDPTPPDEPAPQPQPQTLALPNDPNLNQPVSPVDLAQQVQAPPAVVDAINAHQGLTQAAQQHGYNEAPLGKGNPDAVTQGITPSSVAPAPEGPLGKGNPDAVTQGITPSSVPSTTTAKGEPTPEQDAADLAAAIALGNQLGYTNPDGTPGKGVTVSSMSANLAMAPNISNVTNQNNQNMSFAPAPQAPKGDPDAVTQGITPSAIAAPAPPAPPGQTQESLAAQAAANLAAAIAAAQDSVADVAAAPAPPGPTSVAPSPSSLGLNAPTGVPGVNTGLQHGYFGDPNQTSTLGQVNAALANQAPNEMAMSVTDAQSLANAISMGLTAADAETAADPGIASGITGETADSGIGLSGIGFGDTGTATGTATGADGNVGGVSVGGFGPGIGLGEGQSVGPGPDGGVSVGFGGTADGPSGQAGEAGSIGGAAAAAAGAAAAGDGTAGTAGEAGGPGPGDGVGGGGIGW
jgi:hypothetical protein